MFKSDQPIRTFLFSLNCLGGTLTVRSGRLKVPSVILVEVSWSSSDTFLHSHASKRRFGERVYLEMPPSPDWLDDPRHVMFLLNTDLKPEIQEILDRRPEHETNTVTKGSHDTVTAPEKPRILMIYKSCLTVFISHQNIFTNYICPTKSCHIICNIK